MNEETTTSPEETTTPMYEIVTLDQEQYQTLVSISERTDLLTNRVEMLLILGIVFLAIYIFNSMRSRS